jgi:ABC-type molybdate transport system permease subunit
MSTAARYHNRDEQDIITLGKVILGLFIFAGLAGLAVGILSIISGYGLLNHTSWCRTVALVVAVCYLPLVPAGTAVGVYGLMILLNEETITLLTDRNRLDIRPV